MRAESEADRLEYLRAFGLCIQTDRGTLQAIFDREGQATAIGDMEVTTTSPTAMARTSDVVRMGLKRGDHLTIESVAFVARELRHDGTGMTLIVLDEA